MCQVTPRYQTITVHCSIRHEFVTLSLRREGAIDCCNLSLFQLSLSGKEGGGNLKYAWCHPFYRFFLSHPLLSSGWIQQICHYLPDNFGKQPLPCWNARKENLLTRASAPKNLCPLVAMRGGVQETELSLETRSCHESPWESMRGNERWSSRKRAKSGDQILS